MNSSRSPLEEWKLVVSNACNALRESPIGGEGFLYLTALIFLKFSSDLVRDRADKGSCERCRSVWLTLEVPAQFSWIALQHYLGNPDLPNHIDDALQAIEKRNSKTLIGAFRDLQFKRLGRFSAQGAEVATKIFMAVDRADLRPSIFSNPDEIGDLFEDLLGLMAEYETGTGGEFYVSSDISILLAHLLEPRPGDMILDPFCGSGTLLSRMARHAGAEEIQCAGQTRNPTAASLCQLNLFLRGVSNPQIKLGDALGDPLCNKSGELLKADVVVSNPPFNWRSWGGEDLRKLRPEIFRGGLHVRGGSEYAFLSHMLEVAQEGVGRVGIIVSLGALFRQEDKAIRQHLVEEQLLTAVIGLPPNLFHATSIAVAVLIIDKREKPEDVLFIDASRLFESAGRLNRIPDAGMLRVVDVFKNRRDVSAFSRRVRQEEIRLLDFRLSVPLYVEHQDRKGDRVSIETLAREIREIEGELTQVEEEMDNLLGSLGFFSDKP